MKSREIQRNIVEERSLEQARFHDYTGKLGDSIIEAENKNKNMITDKLRENDTNLKRRLQRQDQSLSNAFRLQTCNHAHSSLANLPPNLPNFIANFDSGKNDELLREINKD